jgi:hypothetical protein
VQNAGFRIADQIFAVGQAKFGMPVAHADRFDPNRACKRQCFNKHARPFEGFFFFHLAAFAQDCI